METQISICSRSQFSPQNQLLADNPLLQCKMFLHLYPQVSTILDSITTYFPLFFSLTNSEPLETQGNAPKQNCTKGQANMDNQRVEFWRDFFEVVKERRLTLASEQNPAHPPSRITLNKPTCYQNMHSSSGHPVTASSSVVRGSTLLWPEWEGEKACPPFSKGFRQLSRNKNRQESYYFSMQDLTAWLSRNPCSMLWWCREPGPTTSVWQGKLTSPVPAAEFQDYPHSGWQIALPKGSLAA